MPMRLHRLEVEEHKIRLSNPFLIFKLDPMTRRELQAELSKLRKQLKRSNELLMRAAAKVETIMALQDECERLKEP